MQKKTSCQAKLIFKEKLVLKNGLLRDGVIWNIPKNERYPDGVKYRLALVDIGSSKVLVLFDNHHPKGRHRHDADGNENPYRFESVWQLVEDYLTAIKQEERKREDQKN